MSEEYSMTQKGLDVVDKIIKNSPQYKELISEFVNDLKQYDKHIFYERSLQKELTELIQKWEERLK